MIPKISKWMLAVLLFCVPVVLPLFHDGYFPTHDGEWAVVRLAEMHRELRDHQFPPRWSDFLNHGYGYPLFLYTYPLPYYVAEVFHIGGLSLIDSVKGVFLFSVIISGLGMYFLAKELNGEEAGFIAGALYVFAPFRLVDIYVRGSIGESVSFAVFPLLFYFTLKLVQYPKRSTGIMMALCISIMILSHNISALVFLPFWLAFVWVSLKAYFADMKMALTKIFLPYLVLGLGLSSFFWLPAIAEKSLIALSQIPLTDITGHFVSPSQWLNSPWTYGIMPSFQLGWIHIVLFLIASAVVFRARGLEQKKNQPFGYMFCASVIALLILTTKISLPFWRLPLYSQIDFPWRLLGPAAFFISLNAAYIASNKWTKYAGFLMIVISFFLIPNFAKPQSFIGKDDLYYQNIDATTTSMDELMPVWVTVKPKNRPAAKVEVVSGRAVISDISYKSQLITLRINAQNQSVLKINTIYFPKWEFSIDGQKQEILYNNPQGLIAMPVPAGNHQIIGQFKDTTVRQVGNIISLGSLIFVFIFAAAPQFRKLRSR